MQEVLAVLEEEADAAEAVEILEVLIEVLQQEVMVQQEAMAEEGAEEGLLKKTEVLVAAALEVLD